MTDRKKLTNKADILKSLGLPTQMGGLDLLGQVLFFEGHKKEPHAYDVYLVGKIASIELRHSHDHTEASIRLEGGDSSPVVKIQRHHSVSTEERDTKPVAIYASVEGSYQIATAFK